MGLINITKEERQEKLLKQIKENPFLTDKELSDKFQVSVQTIRLDRLELDIPEVRERTRKVAENAYRKVKSVSGGEIFGELIDVELGKSAISILHTTPDMVYEKTKIVRGYPIFAQANSLAVAVIDAEVALTGVARIKFKRPVRVGERVIAKAEVIKQKRDNFVVRVNSRSSDENIFTGKFLLSAVDYLLHEGEA